MQLLIALIAAYAVAANLISICVPRWFARCYVCRRVVKIWGLPLIHWDDARQMNHCVRCAELYL